MSQTSIIYKDNIIIISLKGRENLQKKSMPKTVQFQILKFGLKNEEYNLKLNFKMAISTGL